MKNRNIVVLAATALVAIFAINLNAQGAANKAEKKYTRCAAIRMKEISLDHLAKNADKYVTEVPAGWTVISGTGGDGHPKLLLCQ